jgi:6-phosphogluconolactonase
MAQADVRIFANLEELSAAAAEHFCELAGSLAAEGKTFSVALSGGSTAKRLYELLAGLSGPNRWERIDLFQVDERCVPPDDLDSNYRMVREALLDRAPIPRENFHRMRGEATDLDAAAREYAGELERVLQPKPGDWPRFDLILLGMGADGHTASLFPGTRALAELKLWVSPNYVAKLDANRLTLTAPVINAAAEIVFLVAGNDKAETLRDVLQAPDGQQRYPVERICPSRGRLSWYVDRAAARLL